MARNTKKARFYGRKPQSNARPSVKRPVLFDEQWLLRKLGRQVQIVAKRVAEEMGSSTAWRKFESLSREYHARREEAVFNLGYQQGCEKAVRLLEAIAAAMKPTGAGGPLPRRALSARQRRRIGHA